MIHFRHAPIALATAAAVAMLAGFAAPAPALAHGADGGEPQAVQSNNAPTTRAQRKAAEKAAQERKLGRAAKAAPLYPEATRTEPTGTASRSGVKLLQKMQDAYNEHDDKTVLALAGEMAADEDANAYDKSFAALLAGSAAADMDDQATAADYFAKALAGEGLPNNDYYTAMFNLAVTQYGLERYQDSLATLERYITETKSAKPEAMNLKGALLMSLERYADAAAFYSAQLELRPEEKSLRTNAVSAYLQAEQPEKAKALLADAMAKGQLTTKEDYRALYVSYINDNQDKEALAVIDDGLAKGAIQPDAQLAKDYMVLGQRAYYAQDDATAIDMYKRAAPISDDGQPLLNLALLYVDAKRIDEAKAAAQEALAKGVKDTAAAKRILAMK